MARIVADYIETRDPVWESAWIAEVEGEPVGSVFCVRKSEEVAQFRLLLVDPSVRGMGIGGAWSGSVSASPRRRASVTIS
ncbi:MAG: MarR family transcriptional regulator [Streptosporangiaceae bacterium]|nr:MarR family transcriptional regulator [Streptosporangiaceae bacterium]